METALIERSPSAVDALMSRVGAPGNLPAALACGWAALARWNIQPTQLGDSRDFFAAATNHAITALRAAGLPQQADEIGFHAAYLARKRALPDAAALADAPQPDDAHAREAIWNIASLLQAAPGAASPGEPLTHEGVPLSVLSVIDAAQHQLEGWCDRGKALAMARLVLRERPEICVEIGIYGGRSLMPCAAALRANGAGRIWGIECWNSAQALLHPIPGGNDEWWQAVDFPRIKREFFNFLVAQDLSAQICVLETSSRQAVAAFDSIDFLHIDGGHSQIGAAEDVLLYASKVRPGGIIVFDDTDWETTLPAQQLLAALAHPLMTRDQVSEAAYAIFRRF